MFTQTLIVGIIIITAFYLFYIMFLKENPETPEMKKNRLDSELKKAADSEDWELYDSLLDEWLDLK